MVGGTSLQLRQSRGKEYLGINPKASLKVWNQRWFYILNPSPSLSSYISRPPVVKDTRNSLYTTQEMVLVIALLQRIQDCITKGVRGVSIITNFIGHQVQPIKDRAHLAFEYSRKDDPTCESALLTRKEICQRIVPLFQGDMCAFDFNHPEALSILKTFDEVGLALFMLYISSLVVLTHLGTNAVRTYTRILSPTPLSRVNPRMHLRILPRRGREKRYQPKDQRKRS